MMTLVSMLGLAAKTPLRILVKVASQLAKSQFDAFCAQLPQRVPVLQLWITGRRKTIRLLMK